MGNLLSFQFMMHDEWANALFLHWRVPDHMETLLDAHAHPFRVERCHRGHYWIGMVFLTEANVGPALRVLRSPYSCVTHHGVNIRTYLTGDVIHNHGKEDNDSNDNPKRNAADTSHVKKRGIHFASLECNNWMASVGANVFGMPYRYANLSRRYLSSKGSDVFLGIRHSIHEAQAFQLSSRRETWLGGLVRQWANTMLRLLRVGCASSDKRDTAVTTTSTHQTDSFSVECAWKRGASDATDAVNETSNTPDPSFFVERYLVYTRKYGLNWRGQVHHNAWPIERATLLSLQICNVDTYQPARLRPLVRYMADHVPDSVRFSPGVGPIAFDMLQPI